MREFAIATLLVVGALFVTLAAIGILRMPDIYCRLHAASKAATLGIACLGYALVLHFSEWTVGFRALAFGLVLFLIAPISTHLIGRAAFVVHRDRGSPDVVARSSSTLDGQAAGMQDHERERAVATR